MAVRLGRTGVRLYRRLVNGVYRLCSSCCGSVVSVCCGDTANHTLTFTMPGSGLDGVTVPFTNVVADSWTGIKNLATCDGQTYNFTLQCFSSGYILQQVTPPATGCLFGIDFPLTLVSCSPFHLQGTGQLAATAFGLPACKIFCKAAQSGDPPAPFTFDIV